MPIKEPPPRPFLKWVGGKRQLMPELLKAVEAAGPFRNYHEPFLGGGALFFALARSGKLRGKAYLSDVNQNLIDSYIGIRDDVEGVIKRLKTHRRQHSEAHFYKVRARVPRDLTQRAARIIYLNKTCFNGLYRENSKGKFNVPIGRYKNPLICEEHILPTVADALQAVDIAARDFDCALDLAKPGDLIYFDPPYVPLSKTASFAAYSREGFNQRQHERLADTFAELAKRNVKVILSNSITELTQTLYQSFYRYEVLATRSVNARADRRGQVREALITSFPMHPDDESPTTTAPIPANGATGGLERTLAKHWLQQNHYEDIAALIDQVTEEWKQQGKRTRRNWWEVLAGDTKGNPRVVAGREFPVLRAAQLRQGLAVTESAICRNPDEEVPPIRLTGRWGQSGEGGCS